MSKTFVIIVNDSEEVYSNVESFRIEVDTMVRAYILPADVVAVYEVTQDLISTIVGAGRKASPAGSPAPATPLNEDSEVGRFTADR